MHEPGPSGNQDNLIDALMAECLALLEAGGAAMIEPFIERHPAHANALRARLEVLRQTGLIDDQTQFLAAPSRLGDFVLLERLGGGGMGVVHRARQQSLGRDVALKVIRADCLFFDDSARARFWREAEAVAKLQHPGIVPIYAIGSDAQIPYFAMELVPGCSVAEALAALSGRDPAALTGADFARVVCDRSAPAARSPGEESDDRSWEAVCIDVTRQIANALAHAHAHGIVHRDVKPSNIMVTPDGRARLLDFGLARAEGLDTLTRRGAQLGSLRYMPPELLKDADHHGSERSDVYALGVTLYEMLSLISPYAAPSAESTRQRILEACPARLRQHHRKVTWEAETVCQTAMDPDPNRRYASAASMARDLGRVLAHEPIQAKRPSAALRARRWLERHPRTSAALACVMVALLVGPTWLAFEQSAAKRSIAAALDLAQARQLIAQSANLLTADPGEALRRAIEAARRHRDAAAESALAAASDACREVRVFDHDACVVAAEFHPDGKRVVTASANGTITLWQVATGELQLVISCAPYAIQRARLSPDGSRIMATCDDHCVRIWDAATGVECSILRGHGDVINAAEYSPTGDQVVTASRDTTARVWRTSDGSLVAMLAAHTKEVHSAAFSPDARRIVTTSDDGTAIIWDAATGSALHTLCGEDAYWKGVRHASFSPDGKRVVTASHDALARLWDVETGDLLHVLRGHQREVMFAQFSPDGRLVVTASHDTNACLWDVETGALVHLLSGHTDQVRCARFENGGAWVLTAGDDAVAKLWDVRLGTEIAQFQGHRGPVTGRASVDGRQVLTWASDTTARIWDARVGERGSEIHVAPERVGALSYNPGGTLLAAGLADGSVILFDVARGCAIGKWHELTAPVRTLHFSRDGQRLIAASERRNAWLLDVDKLATIAILADHEAFVRHATFDDDGRLALTTSGGVLRIWDAHSGRLIERLPLPEPEPPPGVPAQEEILLAEFVAAGRVVTVSGGGVRLFDLTSGARVGFRAIAGPNCLAVSGNKRRLFFNTVSNPTVRVIDLPELNQSVLLSSSDPAIQQIVPAHDGSVVAVTSTPQVAVFAIGTAAIHVATRALETRAVSVELASDNSHLVVLDAGAVHVHTAPDYSERYTIRRAGARPLCGAFHPGGKFLAIGYHDGVIRIAEITDDLDELARNRCPETVVSKGH